MTRKRIRILRDWAGVGVFIAGFVVLLGILVLAVVLMVDLLR